jgi:hypothetical protein
MILTGLPDEDQPIRQGLLRNNPYLFPAGRSCFKDAYSLIITMKWRADMNTEPETRKTMAVSISRFCQKGGLWLKPVKNLWFP